MRKVTTYVLLHVLKGSSATRGLTPSLQKPRQYDPTNTMCNLNACI